MKVILKDIVRKKIDIYAIPTLYQCKISINERENNVGQNFKFQI